jgi:hypothetical protein
VHGRVSYIDRYSQYACILYRSIFPIRVIVIELCSHSVQHGHKDCRCRLLHATLLFALNFDHADGGRTFLIKLICWTLSIIVVYLNYRTFRQLKLLQFSVVKLERTLLSLGNHWAQLFLTRPTRQDPLLFTTPDDGRRSGLWNALLLKYT